jgi:multiple sugar transport system permease protein
MAEYAVPIGSKAERAGVFGRFRRAFSGLQREESISGYLFLLPNFLGFLVFTLLPILFAFLITLTEWDLVSPPKFVGLLNFGTLIKDDLFWKTLGNTFYFTFGAVPIGIFTAFWLALLMNRKMKGVVFLRTVYFLPQITLMVAVAMVWSWLYQPEFGLINYLLAKVGIAGPRWLSSTIWAMPALIIMSNWKGILSGI